MARDVDPATIMRLDGGAARDVAVILVDDIESLIARWREQLEAQGQQPEQIERLVVYYREAIKANRRERYVKAARGR